MKALKEKTTPMTPNSDQLEAVTAAIRSMLTEERAADAHLGEPGDLLLEESLRRFLNENQNAQTLEEFVEQLSQWFS